MSVRLFTNGPNWSRADQGAMDPVAWLERTPALSQFKTDYSIVGYDSKGHRPDPPRLVKFLLDSGTVQGLREIAQVYFLGFVDSGFEGTKNLFAINNVSNEENLSQAATGLIREGIFTEYFLSPKDYVPA